MMVTVSDCDGFITAYIICTPVNHVERALLWIDGVDCVFCHGGEGVNVNAGECAAAMRVGD